MAHTNQVSADPKNPLSFYPPEKLRDIIRAVVEYDQEQALGLYKDKISKYFPGFSRASKVPKPRVIQFLEKECVKYVEDGVCLAFLWMDTKKELRTKVENALKQRGYTIRKKLSPILWKPLASEDFFRDVESDRRYFRPGGKPIEGEDESEVTLMALLLGWFDNAGNGEAVDYETESAPANLDRSSQFEGSLREVPLTEEPQAENPLEAKLKHCEELVVQMKQFSPESQDSDSDEVKKLLDATTAYLVLFENIKRDLIKLVGDKLKGEILSSKKVSDLYRIYREWKDQSDEAEFKQEYARALEILSDFKLLRNTVDEDSLPLKEVIKKVNGLLDDLKVSEVTKAKKLLALINNRSHPYLSLIHLVRDRQNLSFDACKDLKKVISREFGEECAELAMMDRIILETLLTKGVDKKESQRTGHETKQTALSQEPKAEKKGAAHSTGVKDVVDTARVPLHSTLEEAHKSLLKDDGNVPAELNYFQPKEEMVDAGIAEQSSENLATLLLSSVERFESVEWTEHLLWSLISERKFRLAYLCATFMPSHSVALSPSLLRALLLAHLVSSDKGEIVQLLKDDYESFDQEIVESLEVDDRLAVSFLWASACLRSALLAPMSAAQGVLGVLSFGRATRLHTIAGKIAQFGYLGIGLEPQVLKKVRDEAKWKELIRVEKGRMEFWYKQAPNLGIVTSVGMKIWRRMLQNTGTLYKILDIVRHDVFTEVPFIKQSIRDLVDHDWVRREVETHFAEVMKIHTTNAIVSKAFGQIQRHLRDLSSIANSWLALVEMRPGGEGRFLDQQVVNLRAEFDAFYGPCIEELSLIKRESRSEKLKDSVKCVLSSLEDIHALFDPDKPFVFEEPLVRDVLRGELLLLELDLDENWMPQQKDYPACASKLLNLVSMQRTPWIDVFNELTDKHRHGRTADIIEVVEYLKLPDINPDELRGKRADGIAKSRRLLKEMIVSKLEPMVEDAMALSIIRGDEYEKYKRESQSIAQFAESKEDLFADLGVLKEIVSSIESRKDDARIRIMRKMEEIGLPKEGANYLHISELVKAGDLVTAEDFVNRAALGEEIPEKKDTLTSFELMMSRIHTWEDSSLKDEKLEQLSPQKLLKAVQDGEHFGPFSFADTSSAHRQNASNLLEAWQEMKNTKTVTVDLISDLLTGIGLSDVSVTKRKVGNREVFAVESEAVRDRKRCPVFQYGSEANGKYRILCFWGNPTADIILNEIAAVGMGSPIIVLWFGRMSEDRRRELAEQCRMGRRTFLLIDEFMILYLCTVKGDRLPIFYECALPLTDLEPYTTTASLVPPEIFYGRKREREEIVNPYGSCFLYGGRQLGKTALMRAIQRSFHDPKNGRLAVYVDMRNDVGIGSGRPVEYLWEYLIEAFKRLEVVPTRIAKNAGLQRLLSSLNEWLSESTERRILLLLDEADSFLAIDGRGIVDDRPKNEFALTSRLKALMDDTSRRFKVVFAGLHNVLRTTTLSNHPLAHFGTPVCIGPLLSNDEWQEARELVEVPLRAIGYKFASNDLIMRILSQTNYYPSLIQLYCTQLLQHIRKIPFDSKSSPPYIIQSKHVEDAFNNRNLRNQISDRFSWTLQLDSRYEVIAYSIAWGYIEDPNSGSGDGFSLDWIRQQALNHFREGFIENSSLEAIKVLVDEMIGLGVLQVTASDKYLLRNQNVFRLMGSDERIYSKLTDHRDPPTEYEPAYNRLIFGTTDANRFLSPLTSSQLSSIAATRHGAIVIAASEANGLRDMEGFLREHFSSTLVTVDQYDSVEQFRRFLADIKSSERGSTTIFLINQQTPWSMEWVQAVFDRISNLRNWGSFVRVLFIADPEHLWAIIRDDWTLWKANKNAGMEVVSLRRWHERTLIQWLDDEGLVIPRDERKKIEGHTGRIHLYLKKFRELTKGETHSWKEKAKELYDFMSANWPNIRMNVGLSPSAKDPRAVLKTMADLGGDSVSISDLQSLLSSDLSEEMILKSLEWAEAFDLVSLSGTNTYTLSSFLTKHASSIFERVDNQ